MEGACGKDAETELWRVSLEIGMGILLDIIQDEDNSILL